MGVALNVGSQGRIENNTQLHCENALYVIQANVIPNRKKITCSAGMASDQEFIVNAGLSPVLFSEHTSI